VTTYRTVPEMFLDRVAKTPDREAFQFPTASGWGRYTWREVGQKVRSIAGGLRSLGLQNEQRGGIICSTRVEWILVDIGIMSAGGATTTIYPSNTPEECAYILKDSSTQFLFAENDEQAAKIAKVKAEVGELKKIIVIEGKGGLDGWAITLDELMKAGDAWNTANPGQYEENAQSLRGDSLATLIYTSGTTGQPKGVELTHDCWVYEGTGIEELGLLKIEDVQYLWLPLAHSFGKVLEAAQLKIGFSTAVDGRIDKLVDNLAVVKPTFVAAVPRIFEKVYNKVVAGAKDGGGAKYGIFKWAVEVGKEASKLKQQGKQPGGLLAIKYAIATKLVFSKLQNRFGGRLKYFVSGSAPLSRELAEFFHAADILILEGYGLTESSAASFVNRPDKYRFGTVGLPVPGTQVKLAEDGEILIKGRGIMRGYHHLPGPTAEALDADGWLHTGDIGKVLPEGFLQITDRKKDLIKTSGGKYVAPQELEGKMKVLCPYVSQLVVHGDNRNFCVALVTVEEEAIKKWARESGLGELSYGDIAAHPKTRELLKGFFQQLNANLASYESIKDFAILPADLTQEAGELTPSLKLKRKFVEKKYSHLLEKFYQGSVESI
jgi:long-chain acyl-CoA synthetase